MELREIHIEIDSVLAEFGERPYDFFTILTDSEDPNIDLQNQNSKREFVKAETWHSLDLSAYVLWAISDNGDLLWWNGSQTIAMAHRDSTFVSEPVGPKQFIRLIGMGKVGQIFPDLIVGRNV
jgi:hypothetical protein